MNLRILYHGNCFDGVSSAAIFTKFYRSKINADANVFYTMFGPKGLTPAQTAYWEQAITKVLQSDAPKKDLDVNYWTIDIVGHNELPAFLDRELENYRRVLTDIGMVK